MAKEFVPPVEAAGISAPGGNLAFGICDSKSSEAWRLAQRLDETLPIRVVLEDRFAPVAPIHDVIHPMRYIAGVDI